jgi:Domain of unknown function (DUF6457)
MTAMDWITETTLRVAAATGLDPATLLVDATDATQLLDLAGVAAHDSGERTNAPLLCFVLGRAVAQGAALDDLDRAVRGGAAR